MSVAVASEAEEKGVVAKTATAEGSATLSVEASPAVAAGPCGKRAGYLSWDDYFMSIAFLTAMRSKDPSTQVGACIVNSEHRIVGVGYNGFPGGIPDEALPWSKESPNGFIDTKYPYVCHAELNAVLNKNVESCKGCRLYSTLFPCCECAKVIIQSGIRSVVFASDKNRGKDEFKASKRMFELAGVQMRYFVSHSSELRIPLRYPDDLPGRAADSSVSDADASDRETPAAKRSRRASAMSYEEGACGSCDCALQESPKSN